MPAAREDGRPTGPRPHHEPCPLEARGDWCHFSRRLDRSRAHRLLKGAELGYEDERFSYVAFSRDKALPIAGRVVGHPRKASGHVRLDLCLSDGSARNVVIGRSRGEIYKRATDATWGSEWEEESEPPHGESALSDGGF